MNKKNIKIKVFQFIYVVLVLSLVIIWAKSKEEIVVETGQNEINIHKFGININDEEYSEVKYLIPKYRIEDNKIIAELRNDTKYNIKSYCMVYTYKDDEEHKYYKIEFKKNINRGEKVEDFDNIEHRKLQKIKPKYFIYNIEDENGNVFKVKSDLYNNIVYRVY